MNFCQSISALLQGQKTSQSFFTNNTIQLLENIEKTQSNNTKLRYFERGLAAEMIEKLPTSDEIKQAGAVTEEQAHHTAARRSPVELATARRDYLHPDAGWCIPVL